MANWAAYSEAHPATAPAMAAAGSGSGARLSLSSAEPGGTEIPPEGVVCGVCKQIYPRSQVIQYGSVPVCAACKPAFVQSLKEGVSVTPGMLNYATFSQRFAAKMIDGFIITATQTAISLAISSDSSMGQIVAILFWSGFRIFYNFIFTAKFNATPGKMALGLKVVTPEGAPVGMKKALIRALMEVVSGMILAIGYLMAAWDDEKRTLHDRVAGTRVIKTKK
jgi:uncharacterized RDD family membrane protein YckC